MFESLVILDTIFLAGTHFNSYFFTIEFPYYANRDTRNSIPSPSIILATIRITKHIKNH